MYYQEALKNTPEYVFQQFAVKSTGRIQEFISPFFSQKEAGIHVLIVCLPSDAPLPDNDTLQEALSRENDPCILLPQNTEKIPANCTKRYFFVSHGLNDYEEVLSEVSKHAKLCYGTDSDTFSSLIRISRDYLMTKPIAAALQKALKETLDTAGDHCHTLFLIIPLPVTYFDKIKAPETYLPNFIEYVVLGVGAQEALQKLQEQLKEKDDEIRIIKEENTLLKAKSEKPREEFEVRLRERDEYIVELTEYLLAVMRDGVLPIDKSGSFGEILDRIKKRDDLPVKMYGMINEMESYIYTKSNIKLKTL